MPHQIVTNRTFGLCAAFCAFLFIAPSTSLSQHEHMHDHDEVSPDQSIGTVDFQVDCDDAVQSDFDRALGLMHHMMYEQARSDFEDIIQADPDCAMAHWGLATTLFQPLWGTRPDSADLKRGWQSIEKARERVESERESRLIEATAAFFEDPESAAFWPRIDRWAAKMEAAHQAHPDDLDIAALYSLSLLTLAQRADDRDPLHERAEALLRGVFEEQPTHPGAIHYSIHATDADGRAENALDMVDMYGQIAPEVPHALHMPSHIHVRLGNWPEVIDWNTRSAEAALKFPVGEAVSLHYIHAIDYLIYAHLQRGEVEQAAALYEEGTQRGPHQAAGPVVYHFAAMPARLAVEQRQWEEAAELAVRSPDYLPWDSSMGLWAEGITWLARGLGSIHTDQIEQARQAEQRLQALHDKARADDEDLMATYIDIDRLILSGWLAHAEGDHDRALEQLRAAVELEQSVEKHPVTPGALLPPNEALGDVLMAMDRPEDALEAYRKSDQIWPARHNTLSGAILAAREAGKDEVAQEFEQKLAETAPESSLAPRN